jgi:hypothetical protein
MNNLIEQRKKVYANLPHSGESMENIVLFYDIQDKEYSELIEAVKNFLVKSLTLVYKKDFVWTDTFLEDHNELIMDLPNKTPNGILNPKKETEDEFTLVQVKINQILNNLGISNHIKQTVIPNIRYKNPIEPEHIKTRPYYTSKYHSDAWVGHVGDCQFLIGVLGDIDNNTVEFNEPINVHDNYLHKAESFDEGNTRYESFKELGKLTKQKLVIMDHACLHRTLIQNNSKPRISIDIAVMIDSEYSHANGEGFDKDMYDYHNIDIINSVGITNKYTVEESIFSLEKTTTKKIK